MLTDLPRLQPLLEEIFGSEDYMCWGAGGVQISLAMLPAGTSPPCAALRVAHSCCRVPRCCLPLSGDFCLPGTIEYQHLHRDIGPGDFVDPAGRVTLWDLPPMAVTCNFPMVDFSWENGAVDCSPSGPRPHTAYSCTGTTGPLTVAPAPHARFQMHRHHRPAYSCTDTTGPIRQIPGTQNSHDQPPQGADEPEW